MPAVACDRIHSWTGDALGMDHTALYHLLGIRLHAVVKNSILPQLFLCLLYPDRHRYFLHIDVDRYTSVSTAFPDRQLGFLAKRVHCANQ